MAESQGIYRCESCGNMVKVLFAGAGQLVCCNGPMALMEDQTADPAEEKHVPVIEKVDGGYLVKIGGVPHPMVDGHYIVWIEFFADGIVSRRFLVPGSEPQAFFPHPGAGRIQARDYCCVHGLWRS